MSLYGVMVGNYRFLDNLKLVDIETLNDYIINVPIAQYIWVCVHITLIPTITTQIARIFEWVEFRYLVGIHIPSDNYMLCIL